MQSFKAAVAYVILLLPVLHLILFHLAPDAPVWQNRSANSQQLLVERGLATMEKQFVADANGGNLELHFQGFDAGEFHQGLAMSQFYFAANYALYPHRAFIGQNDRVLHDPAQLAAADVVPNQVWLKQHDVHAVSTLIKTPTGPYVESRQIN